MNLKISTKVYASLDQTKASFDRKLFEKLAPPFPKMRLLRFDGSDVGDIVAVELNFVFWKQNWVSRIVSNKSCSTYYYFIDEGIELPFFFKKWKHRHELKACGHQTIVTDSIYFKGPNLLIELATYPLLLLQFLYRKPVYRKYFKNTMPSK